MDSKVEACGHIPAHIACAIQFGSLTPVLHRDPRKHLGEAAHWGGLAPSRSHKISQSHHRQKLAPRFHPRCIGI